MTLSNLLVFTLALIVAAGSPGPSIAALVARVLSNGFRENRRAGSETAFE